MNLWPNTVIALTLAGIEPENVAVLGLSTKGYYTLETNVVKQMSYAQAPVLIETGPVRYFHEWPSPEAADAVWTAYLKDATANRDRYDANTRMGVDSS